MANSAITKTIEVIDIDLYSFSSDSIIFWLTFLLNTSLINAIYTYRIRKYVYKYQI